MDNKLIKRDGLSDYLSYYLNPYQFKYDHLYLFPHRVLERVQNYVDSKLTRNTA